MTTMFVERASKVQSDGWTFPLFRFVTTFLILVMIARLNSYAQSTAPDLTVSILPPSPTAGELGKYGLTPVGLFTGTANVEIPLHAYSTKNLSLPISMSYNSTGVKVDQVASWVGMGWSVNAGGVITRFVRDEADKFITSSSEALGTIPYPNNLSANNPAALKYIEYAAQDNVDSEPDLFTFNFSGYSGKFIFTRTGAVMIMPHQNIKIERLIDPTNTATLGQFKITTPNGIQYTFAAPETTRTTGSCGKTYDLAKETSWYLTKIEHPAGDIINLEYVTTSYSYKSSISQSYSMPINQSGCSEEVFCDQFPDAICVTTSHIQGKALKRIYSTSFGEIEFIASSGVRQDIPDVRLDEIVIKDRQLNPVKKFKFAFGTSVSVNGFINDLNTDTNLTKRMFLDELTEWSMTASLKKHVFEYESRNSLPARLSYAQDHWGYFNGQPNTTFVVKDNQIISNVYFQNVAFANIASANRQPSIANGKMGLLKKITYPTGGSTEFKYEGNFKRATVHIEGAKTQIDISAAGKLPNGGNTEIYSFHCLQNQNIKISAQVNRDSGSTSEPDAIHDKGTYYVQDITTGEYLVGPVLGEVGFQFDYYKSLIQGHDYVFSVAGRRAAIANLTSEYFINSGYDTEKDVETGGIRIAEISDYDQFSGHTEKKKYSYLSVSSDNSSGGGGVAPIYRGFFKTRKPCNLPGSYRECEYTSLSSSSQNSLYDLNGSTVHYQYVTVTRGDGVDYGTEVHEYIIQEDVQGNLFNNSNEIMSAPRSNTGWGTGLEKSVKYYKNNAGKGLVLIKDVNNFYVQDDRVFGEEKALVVRKKYDPIMGTPEVTVPCTTEQINESKQILICTAAHIHVGLFGGRPLVADDGSWFCVQTGANMQLVTVYNPCHNSPGGIPFPGSLEHIDAQEYSTYSYWFYLDHQTTTNYDDNGVASTDLVEYFYDNPTHAFLTRTRTTRSDGKVKEVSNKYVEDYANVENLATLKDKFILDLPVKAEKTLSGYLIDGKVYKFNDVGQPKESYNYESNILQTPPTHNGSVIVPSADYKLKASLTYVNNNLSEITTNSTPKISYKWGYASTKVIAKIEGAGQDQVFYTSFEDDGEGGTTGSSKTGDKFKDSGTFTISSPPSGSNLMMSYWYWNNSKWNYSGEVPFATTITNGSRLDEIRVYPKGALVTTVAYDTHVDAVKSSTDPNGVTTYYSYDDLGRLIQTRDDLGNIISENQYNNALK